MQATLFAHHVALELMGQEYEPVGFWQHAAWFSITLTLLVLASIGLATVVRRLRRPAPLKLAQ